MPCSRYSGACGVYQCADQISAPSEQCYAACQLVLSPSTASSHLGVPCRLGSPLRRRRHLSNEYDTYGIEFPTFIYLRCAGNRVFVPRT
ncbi:hypothetical protein HZ326_27553 [Fusarium oxysporum f. sp. albedinis]|nr:hypothetical protein HZ326_27553 [Fusarium oxysporum f. sp. albedinis]